MTARPTPDGTRGRRSRTMSNASTTGGETPCARAAKMRARAPSPRVISTSLRAKSSGVPEPRDSRPGPERSMTTRRPWVFFADFAADASAASRAGNPAGPPFFAATARDHSSGISRPCAVAESTSNPRFPRRRVRSRIPASDSTTIAASPFRRPSRRNCAASWSFSSVAGTRTRTVPAFGIPSGTRCSKPSRPRRLNTRLPVGPTLESRSSPFPVPRTCLRAVAADAPAGPPRVPPPHVRGMRTRNSD